MPDAIQLTLEQTVAVSLINVQINQLRSAAFELKHPHINVPEATTLIERCANRLEDEKQAWLKETQKLVKPATVIPDLKLVTH